MDKQFCIIFAESDRFVFDVTDCKQLRRLQSDTYTQENSAELMKVMHGTKVGFVLSGIIKIYDVKQIKVVFIDRELQLKNYSLFD